MPETVCPKCAAKIAALETQVDYLLRHWAWRRMQAAGECSRIAFREVLADCRRLSDPTVGDGEA